MTCEVFSVLYESKVGKDAAVYGWMECYDSVSQDCGISGQCSDIHDR